MYAKNTPAAIKDILPAAIGFLCWIIQLMGPDNISDARANSEIV